MGKLRPLVAQVATKSPSCGNTSVASKSREVILPLHLAPGSCCSVVPNCGLPSIRNTWLSWCESSGGSSKCLGDCSLLHMRTDFLLFLKISVTPTFYQETSSPPLQFPWTFNDDGASLLAVIPSSISDPEQMCSYSTFFLPKEKIFIFHEDSRKLPIWGMETVLVLFAQQNQMDSCLSFDWSTGSNLMPPQMEQCGNSM